MMADIHTALAAVMEDVQAVKKGELKQQVTINIACDADWRIRWENSETPAPFTMTVAEALAVAPW